MEESIQGTKFDQATLLACCFSTYPPPDCTFWCSRKLLIWRENLTSNRPGMSFPGWNREHREAGHQNLPEQWELFQLETLLTSATGTRKKAGVELLEEPEFAALLQSQAFEPWIHCIQQQWGETKGQWLMFQPCCSLLITMLVQASPDRLQKEDIQYGVGNRLEKVTA